jgi:hypothetical protein
MDNSLCPSHLGRMETGRNGKIASRGLSPVAAARPHL